jgi:addiction module HigA family antidote
MSSNKESTAPSRHPGDHVRETVLRPKKMSVTGAAKLLGVGRPALSNFLNGNSALSGDMAARMERAFGIPAQQLLDIQASYDAARAKTKGAPANTKAYVPPFLQIRANEIETWVTSNIGARNRLSVFLRTLVNSTGVGLTKVDFPGNDDAERRGSDGFTVASEGTPWVPGGQSAWEFGCDQDPKSKADDDYAKRTKSLEKAARYNMTFVFVTPRRWPNKEKWESERRGEAWWKDVRVYDASDLEQWLEQSVPAQAWFAGETPRASNGTRSLDKCWEDWAVVAHPPLAGALFKTALEGAKERIASILAKPPIKPIAIAADSTGEALAFLAELFAENGDLATHRDRVVVFDYPGVLPKLAAGSSRFIAVAATREVERELAPFCRSIHTIVVYPRNATNADPDVVLEPLNDEAFRSALEEMGYDRDAIDGLSNESGRSLTVLRRRLSSVDAVRTPEWAAAAETSQQLIPFLFAGAWSSTNQGDQTILSLLADDRSYPTLERDLQVLARLNDAPVWSVATFRGVISKIDLLFAISGTITQAELETYFQVARLVLSEDDPSLDLPEKDRWAAGIFGKTREISSALRNGISETLVLLAVHGNTVFRTRLGMDVEAISVRLIRDLLQPLTTRTLEAHERDLPTYSEAAPDEFLRILEEDLKTADPASIGLMRPADTGPFSGCPRTGLLWALENLAWSPNTLARAALVLAKLAQVKIEDNWVNKPIESLNSIFRSWMPQTAANLDQRLAVMELLADRFPNIAWRICVEQFGQSHRVGHYSHKPRWRTDAHGFGEPITRQEIHGFELKMVEMALRWKAHNRSTIGDLIERLHDLDDMQQEAVWSLVRRWAHTGGTDADKGWVREKIRVAVMSRRGMARSVEPKANRLGIAAKAAYNALEPTDVLSKHEWLFREEWVDESAEELKEREMDLEKRDERISAARSDALREILAEQGVDGVLSLAEMGKTAGRIGMLMVSNILPEGEVTDFILVSMKPGANVHSWSRKNLVYGALRGLEDDQTRMRVLRLTRKALSQEDFTKVLELAPFRGSTWSLVDELDAAYQKSYWASVSPNWDHQSDDELNEAVERLLAAKRPRAAFNCVHFVIEKLRPGLLFRLMTEIATTGEEQAGHYQLDAYYVEKAFDLLDASGEFSTEQMAGLEFPYIDALSQQHGSRKSRGIPNLERYVEKHPELFVQAIGWTYKRRDGGEDPKELRSDDLAFIKSRAERGYRLLESLQRIPGRNKLDEVEADRLLDWVNVVRQSCAELGRQEVGDLSLGKLFSNAHEGVDGVWPSEPLREVLEQIQSDEISNGITMGLYNARGVHWRGEGGNQERELAAKYRGWAHALEFSHPFVASTILKKIGDTYENEANREDAEAGIRRRLR